MPITSNWRKGLSHRIRDIEVATALTPTDRNDTPDRLAAAELDEGLAPTGAAKIRNNGLGFENRLKALEAAV